MASLSNDTNESSKNSGVSRLGKGLGALISDSAGKDYIKEVEIDKIIPNPMQPRKIFDLEKIDELSQSITEQGILQPIIVRQINNNYEIIAGERRFKAAKKAGLLKVPVIIKKADDEESLEIAIIENVQREDLSAIEEGEAYKLLIEKYNYTQEALANRLGKNRATITNTLRLLKLPTQIKDDINSGKMTSGHARAILAIENEKEQLKIAEKVINENLSVRDVEKLVKDKKEPKKPARVEKKKLEIVEIESMLRDFLGTKVKIKDGNNKGKIEIEYYSDGDLERILETIGAAR